MFTSEKDYLEFKQKLDEFKSHAESCVYVYAEERLMLLRQLLELENVLDIADNYGDGTPIETAISDAENIHRCSFKGTDSHNVNFLGKVPACSRGCCGYTTKSMNMPVRCLWNVDKIKEIAEQELAATRKELEGKVAAKQEAERQEMEENIKRQEAYDKEEYERLKEKFKEP